MPDLDLSLVIPCYNEEEVLRQTATRLVECLRGRKCRFELVLVDNGSRDQTGQIIDALIAEGMPVVKRVVQVNQGYGHGVLTGLAVCQGKGVGFACADGQVDAEDILKIYDIAANLKRPSLVKVRRRFRMDGFTRKVVSVIYNCMTAVLFGGLGS